MDTSNPVPTTTSTEQLAATSAQSTSTPTEPSIVASAETTQVATSPAQAATTPVAGGAVANDASLTALGNFGFQNLQSFDSMGDDASSFLIGRYDEWEQTRNYVFTLKKSLSKVTCH